MKGARAHLRRGRVAVVRALQPRPIITVVLPQRERLVPGVQHGVARGLKDGAGDFVAPAALRHGQELGVVGLQLVVVQQHQLVVNACLGTPTHTSEQARLSILGVVGAQPGGRSAAPAGRSCLFKLRGEEAQLSHWQEFWGFGLQLVVV